MSDNSGIQEIIMYRSRAWKALKIGTLIGVGGFLILSTLILKNSDAQDVFPQIRFVRILCAAVLFFCGFVAWDNFQVAKKLRKALGECADFAQRYKEGCAREEL